MNAKPLTAGLCLCLVALSGCVTTTGSAQRPSRLDPQKQEVRDLADRFISLVMTSSRDEIGQMVLPAQAKGFSAKVFVEGRFRMKRRNFQIIAWDKLAINVTPLKTGSGMLSTAIVTVRMLPKNEIKPVYVNLHWRRHAGKWCIDAFPRQ
ncbi:MAG: hypothetical protein J7M19_06890 [Planctomycetes bacterium]|nr:hypothetical protein [Planctomycetota bacterium]